MPDNKKEQNPDRPNNQSKQQGQASTASAAERKRSTSGESTASNAYKNETGDPGRTPGSAEGVEDFQETGNE